MVFGQDTGACGVANPGNQVSEMSMQYNKSLNKYVVLYGDQFVITINYEGQSVSTIDTVSGSSQTTPVGTKIAGLSILH